MFNIKRFIFNPVRVNTYLVWDDTKEAAIIDCGAYNDSEKTVLKQFIEDNGLKLKLVLNTHLHFDHVLGNSFLFDNYALKPQYSLADESMPNLGSGGFFLPIKAPFVKAEKYLEDGSEIVFGNTSMTAIATPGHSPGGLSFYCRQATCIFTGDTLFCAGIGRTDLWKGNYDGLINSIRTKLLVLPNNTTVYPGHDEATSIGAEKRYHGI